ncbi:MAG: choice-of-anchor E domain-containing protein [Isosphaeraceae bacterium]
MSNRLTLLARICLGVTALGIFAPAAAGAGLITQNASLPLTPTDFSPSSQGVQGNPLVFNKFDTQENTLQLDGVTLTVHAKIQNEFGMKFYTPATITNSVATGNPAAPGPSITMFQPDGKTPLLSVQAPNDPALLSRSVTYGSKAGETMPREFSSQLDPASPFYLAPTSFERTESLKLTSPADLALFTGTGTLSLPVEAAAWSNFTSSSGNGFGSVTTDGTASVTVEYAWSERVPAPQVVPEPATCLAWGLGGLALALRGRSRLARRRLA